MNSIFKLITNQQIPETANALVPVIGYEPWSLRALESIKSSIVNGVPTLIRVHSAADYPIENEELSHRLDIDDIPVNRHLAEIGTDPLGGELSHLLFNQSPFLRRHRAAKNDGPFPVRHSGYLRFS